MVASNRPFEVTVIWHPELAFSKYLSKLDLKSLIVTVSIENSW